MAGIATGMRSGLPAFGRRGVLGLAAGLAVAAGGCAAFKVSKAEAAYQNEPFGEERCGNCRHYVSTFDACTEVEGDIAPDAWCRLWQAN